MKLVLRVLAWLALALIAFVTLSPVTLRPHVPETSPYLEYVGAFVVIGLLFGLGYPRRLVLIGAFVVAAVIGLELAQMLTADRHGRLLDGAAKLAGAVIGLGLSELLRQVSARLRPK